MTCADPHDLTHVYVLMGVLVGLVAGKLLSDWEHRRGPPG